MPLYLHPRNPLPSIYEGHRWLLGPSWAFGLETAVHALRLIGSGLFDKFPRLAIILGHLGEAGPLACVAAAGRITGTQGIPRGSRSRIFSNQLYLTTSGNFHAQALINALLEIGADRIMFSTDWPFEDVSHAARWFDAVEISGSTQDRTN